MKTVGIICEYNPFHLGHQRQFRLIRAALGEETALVCVMSGDFVQRGEPALYAKEVRAEAAVRAGADLVLELPVTCALRSAEGFAAGGVEILDGLGIIDALSFGCERPEGIRETAALLLRDDFSPVLRRELVRGISFAAARQRAVEALGGDGAVIASPNNILGVEYCKALLRQESRMMPMPLRRDGDYHAAEPDPSQPSATSLRALPDCSAYVPEETRGCYAGAPRYRLAFGERAMLARLRTLDEAAWAAVPYGSEGLWRKVRRACLAGGSVQEILTASKSKRYAAARLSRLLLCAYLGISQETLDAPPPYVRILGFSDRGRTLLRLAQRTGRTVLIRAGEVPPEPDYAALETRCALLYDLFCERPGAYARRLAGEKVFFSKKAEMGLAN